MEVHHQLFQVESLNLSRLLPSTPVRVEETPNTITRTRSGSIIRFLPVGLQLVQALDPPQLKILASQ